MTDTIEGTGVALEPVNQTIFEIADPAQQLVVARRMATLLSEIIEEKKLSMRIGASEHVFFEGWATLGAMNGISVHTVWSRPLEDGRGWEARAEARTLDARVVGSAEGMCSRDERNWRRAEDYAMRSMAQTRAGSKALKGPLSWVMTLAGKSGTPAEELGDSQEPLWQRGVSSVTEATETIKTVLRAMGVPEADDAALAVAKATYDEADERIPMIVMSAMSRLLAATMNQPAATEAEYQEQPPSGAGDDKAQADQEFDEMVPPSSTDPSKEEEA
jgi:hypothetical protein